ncbi:stressosome-associated protein Prli42 [Paenibacillus dokdonensis]|uniref:Stressosome-associated protein Prli42 n=1 Tax=Paenibacillus dokdonensis TaxID=2567944 RepID=A0ABU6GUH3_9BACL|nr:MULTISPECIES: stressosome-associated protein Prli42 [Paenibacillus]MEC0243405.1 stressosome-associated protein Prli42 [Paenibacillus dokdonensis]
MQNKKWFRVFIYLMLIAMVGSVIFGVVESLIAR